MIWIILIIVIIVLIVRSNNKKKASGTSAPTAAAAKPTAPAEKEKPAAKVTAAEESALSGIDRDAFARAFAHMSDADEAPAKPAEPSKPAAPSKSDGVTAEEEAALSGIDRDAFARAFAHMSDDGEAPQKPEEPKPAPDDGERYDAFLKQILAYYHSMWNKETGSLYTELDITMPIDHFAIQARQDCLVESVWLIDDNIPLVSETAYTKLCGDTPVYDRMGEPEMQRKLLGQVAEYLTGLGTVEQRGGDFYPIRAKKAAPADGGKVAEEFADADQEARLRAQIQAMLDQQKQDDQK